MKTLDITDDNIMTVWNWCLSAYLHHGRKLRFPKGTDPQKTYQWRYAKSLTKKFIEWEFSDETAQKFISIAVDHADSQNKLNKGLAALHQDNLLKICYDTLMNDKKKCKQSFSSLEQIKIWFDNEIGNKDPVKMLLKRKDPDMFCNLTLWYQSFQLSPLFLSLSRACGQASVSLSKVDECERSILPDPSKLYLIRTKFLNDQTNIKLANKLLGEDSVCNKTTRNNKYRTR